MSFEPCVEISPGCGDFSQPISFVDDGTGLTLFTGAPPAEDEKLAPCPFCGCDYPETEEQSGLQVCNTHTPAFWITCGACGAEQHAHEHEFPLTVDIGKGQMGYTAEMFVEARAAAVAAWNTRDQRYRIAAKAFAT